MMLLDIQVCSSSSDCYLDWFWIQTQSKYQQIPRHQCCLYFTDVDDVNDKEDDPHDVNDDDDPHPP